MKSRVFLRGNIIHRKYSEAEHHAYKTSRNRDFFSKFSLKSDITTINFTTLPAIFLSLERLGCMLFMLLVENKYYLVLCMPYAFESRFSSTAQYGWVRGKILELFTKFF